jgi:hypothetical protein
MANNYYDATGVLVLDRVTPVITALFGAFNLDETYPGDGKAYIARISETNDPQWSDVLDGLIGLAVTLNLPMTKKKLSIEDVLTMFARHFGVQDDKLESLSKRNGFEDTADIEDLFLIASRLDDGHHLSAILFEGCWHCSKPRLFEFGGEGLFISREIRLHYASHEVLLLGKALQKAILEKDVDTASSLLAAETLNVLAGIGDARFQEHLRRRIVERLTIE